MNKYVVAGSKPWNRHIFQSNISTFEGEWYFVDNKNEITVDFLEDISPRFVFFLHWSWIVPKSIVENFECVCFHMTDVPYGRGGSPLQNLIIRGHRETKLTALRMVQELDAGPVYMKRPLSLEGSAEEIYIRASQLSAEMIKELIATEPNPTPQTGEIVSFQRRRPEDSLIPEQLVLSQLHDFIRMLDAEGYPKAFLEYNGFRFEFSRAALYGGRIIADVTISPIQQ